MKSFLIGLLALASLSAYADETKHITLEAKNTASLREEFDGGSVDAVKSKLIELDQTLGPKEELYLYLNTPGGSIIAGNELIDVTKGLKHKVNVIVNFAASMGYMTTQAITGKRYITGSGVLMAHRAYVGTEGNSPGNFEQRVAFNQTLIKNLETIASSRVGLSLDDYRGKVREEYWVTGGSEAVKQKQADEVVNVACSSDLNGTTVETVYTMFGPIGIVWANCPLISQPVGLDFSAIRGSFDSSSSEFESVVTQVYMNPRTLLNPEIRTKFNKYLNQTDLMLF
jgi:ATP-dependent protease ClpP protease subunit